MMRNADRNKIMDHDAQPLDPVKGWNRALWGVRFTGADKTKSPMLIGSSWATDLGGTQYLGEPTRALLFRTRAQARAWCRQTLSDWRNGRHCDDSVRYWRVMPVRVREIVQQERNDDVS